MSKLNDKARNYHLAEIERLKKIDLLCHNEGKRDKTIAKKLLKMEKQLILYDKVMGY